MELIQKSSQIQHQADIVTAQSDKSVVEVKKSLADYAETLRDLNEASAVLDMLCSFAHLTTSQNYVRPLISDNLILKGARHPVVEARKDNFVPNDVYSGDQDARFKVITGGNMSGKSTFIRSIALIQLMAQIGSFVPAQYAAIPICDRLFTRLSTEDKPESNMGTFAVEMSEINVILRYLSLSVLFSYRLLIMCVGKSPRTAWLSSMSLVGEHRPKRDSPLPSRCPRSSSRRDVGCSLRLTSPSLVSAEISVRLRITS